MAVKQYLDSTGLGHLWTRIGEHFDAKGAADAVVVEAEGDTYVEATAVADKYDKTRKVTVKATEALTKAVTAANAALPKSTYETFVAGTSGDLKTNLATVKVEAGVGGDKLVTASADTTGRIITVGTTPKLQTAVSDLGLKDDDNAKDTAFGRIKKAEEDITSLKSSVSGGTFFKGVVDALPEATSTDYKNGDIVAISSTAEKNANKEFIYSGEATKGKWIELGDTTAEAGRITKLEDFNKSAFVNNPEGTATEKVKAALLADNATMAYDKDEQTLTADILKGKAATAGTADTANATKATLTVNDGKNGTKTFNGSTAVEITKADLGLGNVDNTADSDKSVKHAAHAEALGTEGALLNAGTDTTPVKFVDGKPVAVTAELATKSSVDGLNGGNLKVTGYTKEGASGDVAASDFINAAIAKVEAKADSAIANAGVTSITGADKFVGVDRTTGAVKLTVTSTDTDCTGASTASTDVLATAKAVDATIKTLDSTVNATAAKVDGSENTKVDHVYVLTGVTEAAGKLTGKAEVEFASMSNDDIDIALGLKKAPAQA